LELETWPNFLLQCSRRGIPVLLVNGRITDPSFRRYRWALPVVRRMFRRLASLCVQEQTYADRLIALGAPPDRVTVTGTMKFDTAVLADRVDGDAALAADLLLHPAALPSAQHSALSTQHFIWVCGSTGPGEEQLILQQYRALLAHCPTLLLVIVPRKPERFDQVAGIITAAGFDLVRRSSPPSALGDRRSAPLVILGDTMGELPKFYSLADVVFVGRTLVDLGPRQHGSDMIEPAALGKPVIVGPFTGNFADAMSRFRAAQAIIEVQTADELAHAVRRLLSSPQEARALADRARQVVNQEKGATERHVQTILSHLK
jgi:3-deoxy-D-manno-octulosonic-acid transferase